MPAVGFCIGPKLNAEQQSDVQFGFRMAKEISRLEIGQSVVVKGGTVLAVEGFEGTDQCLRRGGELAGRDGGAVAPIYLRQMALYRAALAHAFPGRNVRAILVYTDGPKVIELSTDALDEIISRVSASRAAHGSVA